MRFFEPWYACPNLCVSTFYLVCQMDLTDQFFQVLDRLLHNLGHLYPKDESVQSLVRNFDENKDKDKVLERSLAMWHASMEPFYLDIAQTKNQNQTAKALARSFEKNWFFRQLGMERKWKSSSFNPSREVFVQAVRVLNGLAFLQHSFISQLGDVMSTLAQRFQGNELSPDAIHDVMEEMMRVINPDSFGEITRMFPHLVHIVGGIEHMQEMIDAAFSESGQFSGILHELIGAFAGDEIDTKNALQEGKSMIQNVMEQLADPEADTSSLLPGLTHEEYVEAFEELQKNFNSEQVRGALGIMASAASETSSLEEVGNAAMDIIQEAGVTLDSNQLSSIHRAAAAVVRQTQESMEEGPVDK